MSLSPEELDALLSAPALDVPAGETADFDNPPNQNALAVFVTTFCIVVATACLVLRTYVRTWKERKLHKEEVLMFGAYGAYWGTAYAGYAMVWTPGYYIHQWNLHNGDLVQPLYLILIYGCCYSVVLPLIKTAILFDWCRVFVLAEKGRSPFWWASVVLSVLQCAWGVACIILLNFQCIPHQAIWEFYLPAKCYPLPSVMLGSASVQVATDFAMVMLPQRIIWSLRMNWQKKLGVSVVFGVGLIACIAACFRLNRTITFSQEPDKMYYIGPLLFWAWAEMTAGFFILSVPCLPKLIAESGLSLRIKRALGITFGSKPPTDDSNGLVTIGGSGGSKRRPVSGLSPEEGYYKVHIDGDGTTVSDMDRHESQEHLRGLSISTTAGVTVTRTTKVVVGSDSPPGSDTEEIHSSWTR